MTSTEAGERAIEDEESPPQSSPDDVGGEADDRWQRFAARDTDEDAAPLAATRGQRIRRRIWATVRHEWTIAGLASVVLAMAMNWRVLTDPMHSIPHDLGDPLQQAHILSWSGHALWTNPMGMWNTNVFYPATHSFAFTDTLLGYLPLSLIGTGHEAALLRYNIVYLATFALAFFGAYVLLRQLGARTAGSAVGAAAFAYAPWKLAHEGHLNVLSIGAIALSLAMLARGHGWSMRRGYEAKRVRPGWVIGGWLVAAWQVSLGFAMGVAFGYFLGATMLVTLVVWAVKRFKNLPWRIIIADAAGGIVFAATALALSIPYFRVAQDHPEANRSLDDLDMYSPQWSSFLTSPSESVLWGAAHAPVRDTLAWAPEMSLLVGFTVTALAIAGLFWSAWSLRQRAFLLLGATLSVVLALGTNFLDDGAWTYGLLFNYVPGFDGLRTPGRLVLYTCVVLAVLAAGTLTHLADRIDKYAEEGSIDARWSLSVPVPVRLALFLPLVLVLMEGYSSSPMLKAPEPPIDLAGVESPALVLPSDDAGDYKVQYWTIDGYPQVANGTAAFTPEELTELRESSEAFPAARSVEALRDAGIETVVLLRNEIDGTPWQYVLDQPRTDSSITVTDHGDVIVFSL